MVNTYGWNASGSYWGQITSAYTGADGNYDLGGLPSGTYRLEFNDYSGSYLSEYYNNQSSLDLADDIAVAAPETVAGINASLALAGHITGKVTGPDGTTPLQDINFYAY